MLTKDGGGSGASDPHHVMDRDMLCNGNDEGYLSFQGLLDRLGRLVSGDVDGRSIWVRLLFRLESVIMVLPH